MVKKDNYTVLLIIIGCLALNFLHSPLSEIFFDDKDIFRYIGQVIYKGGVPYRDVFDNKPPLIYFFYTLGWYGNAWLPWLLDSLLVLFATILFYRLCRKNELPFSWFLPLIFNLLIRYGLVSFGNGMTREYTTVFILIFFCTMQGKNRYTFYILGLLTGLILWMQQDAIFTLSPFLLYSLFISKEGSDFAFGKRILNMAGGFFSVTLLLLLYFYSHNALAFLWNDAFLFNLQLPRVHKSLIEEIKTIKHALHEAEYEMAFYTSTVLGTAALFLKNKNLRLLWVALSALFLSFAGEFISGRISLGNQYLYYLLPLAATMPILIFVVFTNSQESFLEDKKVHFIFYMILSFTLFLGTLRYAMGLESLKDSPAAEMSDIDYLDLQRLKDFDIYVFGDSNFIYLYNKYKLLAPSPWIYPFFLNLDKDNSITHSIFENLKSHKTKFILDCSDVSSKHLNESIKIEWKKFIETHYKLIQTDPSNRKLWRIQ